MSLEFVVLIEKDEDGVLVATCPQLKGCHTQAKSMDALIKRIKEVIKICLKEEKKSYKPLEFIGLQEIKVVV